MTQTPTPGTAVTVQPSSQPAQGQRMPAPLASGGRMAAVIPQDLDQAWRMAELIHRAQLAPKELQSQEKISVAIFHGLEVGLPPMQAVQSIAVINGRPVVWGDAAKALVLASGLAEQIVETVEGEGNAMVAVCRVKRKGDPNVHEQRFSVADAQAAQLWSKDIWKKYPRRMLQMRARAFALRDKFPDVLKGLAVAEEVQDYSDEPVQTIVEATTAADLAIAAPKQSTTTAAALTHQPKAPADEPAPPPEKEPPVEQPPVEADDPAAAGEATQSAEPEAGPTEAVGSSAPDMFASDGGSEPVAAPASDAAPETGKASQQSPQDSRLHVKIPMDEQGTQPDFEAYAMALRAVASQQKTQEARADFIAANPAIERLAFDQDVPQAQREVIAGVRADMRK